MSLFKKAEYYVLFDSIDAVVKDARQAMKKEEKKFVKQARFEQQERGYATDVNVIHHYAEKKRILKKLKTDLLIRIGFIDQHVVSIMETKV